VTALVHAAGVIDADDSLEARFLDTVLERRVHSLGALRRANGARRADEHMVAILAHVVEAIRTGRGLHHARRAVYVKSAMPTPDDFLAIDIRVGTILRADPFPEARKPSIKLLIDFGPELGLRRSSAQLTVHYSPQQLIGRQIAAVVNIGERQIAGFTSQVLVLGALPQAHEVVLLAVDQPVPNGTRIG
jgi:tRNA-binding protein